MPQGFRCARESMPGHNDMLHLVWPGLHTVCGKRVRGSWLYIGVGAWRDGTYPRCTECWERFRINLSKVGAQVKPELDEPKSLHELDGAPILTDDQHRQRHVTLHQMFDELLTDFLLSKGTGLSGPSSISTKALMLWSRNQTTNPVRPPVRDGLGMAVAGPDGRARP